MDSDTDAISCGSGHPVESGHPDHCNHSASPLDDAMLKESPVTLHQRRERLERTAFMLAQLPGDSSDPEAACSCMYAVRLSASLTARVVRFVLDVLCICVAPLWSEQPSHATSKISTPMILS
jgi:hypothetical protein